MRKICILAALMLSLSLVLGSSAWANVVEVPNPGNQFWDSTAQAIATGARNGNSSGSNPADYGIAMGVTDLSNPSNIILSIIKPWDYGLTNPYHFTLQYDIAQGDAKLAIYDQTNTLFGSVEQPFFGFSGFPDYRNHAIYTIRLNYIGNADVAGGGRVEISNLKFNGAQLGQGAYDSGNAGGISNNFVYFGNSDGSPLPNFLITGDFVFTGSGGTVNYPGFEFDLSAQPVPLPPSVLLLGSSLLGLAAYENTPEGNV